MKKLLSMLIAVIMVLSMFPAMIFTSSADDSYVAMIGETGYASLTDAVSAAESGATIVLMQDVTLATGANIQIDKSLTFDLNEKTISGSVSGQYVGLFSLKAAVDLTVKNGKLINESTDTTYTYIIAGGKQIGANVTLEKCNMTVSSKGVAYGVYLYPTTVGGNLTVADCTIDISGAKTSYGINHYCSSAVSDVTVKNCIININSENTSGYGISTSATGSVSLTGNKITVESNNGTGYGVSIGKTGGAILSENTITVQTERDAYGYNVSGAITNPAIGYNDITLSAGEERKAYPVTSSSTALKLSDGIYTVNSGTPTLNKVTLEGGYTSFEAELKFCKAGYYSAPAEDKPGYYTLAEITPENAAVVATKDGETKYYATISSAASECGEGWTLTVRKDLTDSSAIGSASAYAEAAIVIKSGVTVTTTTSARFCANNLMVETGAAVIAKTTFKVSGVNNGTITLTNNAYTIELSNFTNNGSIVLKYFDSAITLTDKGNVVNNGTISCVGEASNSPCRLVVSADGITGSNPYPHIVGKYYWDYDNNVWYEYYGPATVISPDGTQKHYESFSKAYDDAAEGDIIRLNENQNSITFNNKTNFVEKNITLDLNGRTFGANHSTAGQADYAIGVTNGYTLTIIDGSKTKSGTVTIVGSSPSCVVKVNNGGTLIVDGVSITKGYNILYSEGGAETPDTIIVKNSTIRGVNYGINHNGSHYGVDVTVENSTIEATGNSDYSGSGAAIYLSGQSNLEQNNLKVVDSTVSGPTAIETKYSDVEVVNSRIETTAKNPAYIEGGNGICTMGFAVVSTDNNATNSTGSITISGENTVITGYVGLETSGIEEVKDVKTDVQISGGTFDHELPAEYCAEGFTPVPDENGNYVVRGEETPVLESFKIAPESELPDIMYPGDQVQMVVTDIKPAGAKIDKIEWLTKITDKSNTVNKYIAVDETGLVTYKNKIANVDYRTIVAKVTNEDGTVIKAECEIPESYLPEATISSKEILVGTSATITSIQALKDIGVEDIRITLSEESKKDNFYINEETYEVFALSSNTLETSASISIKGKRKGVDISQSISSVKAKSGMVASVSSTTEVFEDDEIQLSVPHLEQYGIEWKVSDQGAGLVEVDQNGRVTVKAVPKATSVVVYASVFIDGFEYKSGTILSLKVTAATATVDGVVKRASSLSSAIGLIPANGTGVIDMFADFSYTATLSISSGKNITINFNDHLITANPTTVTTTYTNPVFSVTGEATLTINADNGGIVSGVNKNGIGKNLFNIGTRTANGGVTGEGTLIINSGNFEGAGTELVYVMGGEAIINGGNFESKHTGTQGNAFMLNCNDDSRREGNAKITVNGGTFVDFDPQNNAAEGTGTNFLAPGLESYVDENGNFSVREESNDLLVNTKISFTVGNTMTLNLFINDNIYGNAYTADHCTAYVDALIGGEWVELGSADVKPENATVEGDTATMKFSVGGIPMAYLSNEMRVRFYAYGDKTYSLELAELDEGVALSFVNYAEALKENPEVATDKLVDLLNAMLNYTAAVQQYKGYNTDNLANAGLSDEEKAVPSIVGMDFSEYANALKRGVSSNASATVVFDGSQLLMNSDKTGFQFYFTVQDGVDVSALELQVKYNGKTVVIPASTFKSRGEGQYSAIFEGLDPTEFDAQLTAAIFAGADRKSNVAYDSIPATAKLVSEDARYASMVEIYSGMLAYCKAAKAYISNPGNIGDDDKAEKVSSVEELKTALSSGAEKVVLTEDMEISEIIRIPANAEVVIDLNGHTLDASKNTSRPIEVSDGTNLTINGGNETVKLGAYGLVNIPASVTKATITLNGGSYIGKTNNGAIIKPRGSGEVTVNLNNVTVHDDSDNGSCIINTGDYNGDLYLNVNGGSYTGYKGFHGGKNIVLKNVTMNMKHWAVYSYEDDSTTLVDGCDITVTNEGTVSDNSNAPNACVAVSSNLTVVVKNSKLTNETGNATAVYSSGGNIEMENCQIIGRHVHYDTMRYKYPDAEFSTTIDGEPAEVVVYN